MPSKFYHYAALMRLGSPTGYFLVFFPTLFGILLSADNFNDLRTIHLFLLGSIIARAAGCIVNDITDRKLDLHVTRTKHRPLTSGKVTMKESVFILFISLLLSLLILLQLSVTSIIIGMIAFCLMLIYPLMKRFTYFPQVFLGVTFNLGCLIGYASSKDLITMDAMIIYAACCFWTLSYDTIYAFMDIKDDKKIGIKSTAVFFEKKAFKLWISLFYVTFLLLFAGINLAHSNYLAIISTILAGVIFYWQVNTLDINDPKNCSIRFKSNSVIGFVLALGMLADFFIKAN